ncbi:MAG: FAD-dependent oxidoreductase [Tepidisphaeraceae bacterium]
MHSIPTLIIGAGVAGASLACSLAERKAGQGVAIVDLDVFGRYGSSELNGGGVRCTFAEPINIKLALASVRYYLEHAKQFDFRQRGYLWMYDEELWDEARVFLPLVRSFGLPVEELAPAQLREKFPVLDDVSDLAGATFTPFDGRLSPHRLRTHYINHAQAGGVELLSGWQVVGIDPERSPYRVTMRRVSPRSIKRALTDGEATSNKPPKEPADELVVSCDRVVNAAGPWAPEVARLYGRELPITPLPRQVFLLRHPDVNLEPDPFFIDYPQDIYFRHYEYDRRPCTLVSWSDPEQSPGHSFAHDGQAYYDQHVRPRLVKRIARLNDATLAGGWTGHYELTPDKAAIVGDVPNRPGIYNYNGLSAHGVMQSRGIGEALAERFARGAWPADLNLDELSESRFGPRKTLAERMYV